MDLSELGAVGGVEQRAGLSVVSLGGKDGLQGQQLRSGGWTGQLGEAGVKLGLTPKLHTAGRSGSKDLLKAYYVPSPG